MRTTVDLPDDLYELARHLAHEGNRSMSSVIAELIRVGLRREQPPQAAGPRGMPQIALGHPVTTEDVRALDDEE